MNKLVTLIGGGGFVGRYAAQALMKAGYRVRIAQRDPRQAYFLKPLGALGQTQYVAADIRRPETIARAVEGAEAVVNLVGTFGDFDAVQARGAGTVAEAAARAGAGSLVHVSAIGADPAAASDYARSKGRGEEAVRAAFAAATILRPSVVFGREDQFVNRFARQLETFPVMPVLRAGTKFQPVFVADVADAIAAAVATPDAFAGQTAELGGPDVLTMGALVRWIAATTGRSRPIVELPDIAGAVLARLPGSPISTDQWLMLQQDNVAAAGQPGLPAFGVTATPLAAVAPGWLVRFRKAGRFAKRPQTTA